MKEWQHVVFQSSAPFWNMIQKRRGQKTIPMREMRKRTVS